MVSFKRGKNHLIAELSGEVILENSTIAKNEIKNALLPEEQNVIIDLSKVTLLDSAGVGILVSILKTLEGGQLHVVVSERPIRRVLEITRMDRIIPLYKDVSDAVASISS